MNFFRYLYKAYIKKNILSNYRRKNMGHLGENVLLEAPMDYGDYPQKIRIGNSTTILKNSRLNIYAQSDNKDFAIDIGENCYIGSNFSVLAKAKVTIENDVLIVSNVLIASENHGMNPETNEPYMSQELSGSPVKIGEGCWIGEKVIILPGASIGKKCVIGAGSVIVKSIPNYCIAVGNPARVIKQYNFDRHMWEGVDK